MKGSIITLVGIGGAALIYALISKAKASVKAQTKATNDVSGSYYNPTAHIWSEEQPSNNGTAIPANPITGELPTGPGNVTVGPYDQDPNCRIYGPCQPSGDAIPANPPAGMATIGTKAPDFGVAPPQPLSPTFWAADKVPTNPALQTEYQTMDANPTLGDNLGTYLLPTVDDVSPVNQV